MTDKTDDKRQAALAIVRDLQCQAQAFLDHAVDQGWVHDDCDSDGIAFLKDAIKNAALLTSLPHPECESVTVEELASMFSTDDAMSKAIDITNTLDNLGLKIIPSNGEKK